MNCTKCGQPLTESAKFCPSCGTRVEQQQSSVFCSACGTKLEPSAQFCPACGVRVGSSSGSTSGGTTGGMLGGISREVVSPSGRLLASLKMVSMYEGTPTVGIAKATGPLSIYDDRIEFKKTMGNALGGAFGLIGMAVAQNKVKNDPINIYPVSQIAELRVGKYGGVYNTLVVVMRDGTTVSFCPAIPGSSEPQNIINNLQQYLR